MGFIHKELAEGRWFNLSFLEQMANIGTEVERGILWRKKNNTNYSKKAIERALELLDFTLADPKNRKRLKELARLREVLVDYFYFDNIYGSSDELWHKYFLPFNYAVRLKRDPTKDRKN